MAALKRKSRARRRPAPRRAWIDAGAFRNPFFTVVKPADALAPELRKEIPARDGYLPTDLWRELASLGTPVTPNGQVIVATVEGLAAQTRLKTQRAAGGRSLLPPPGPDILAASCWTDVRRAQMPERKFGAAPEAALAALRQVIPWRQAPADPAEAAFGHGRL